MKRKRMVSVVLVSAAVVAVLAAIPASAGTARSFFSTAVKRPIPDAPEGGGVLSKLQIRSGGRIADIEVGIRINHTATTDLNIYLVSPQGKFVELSTDNGGGGNNYGTGSNSCGGGGSFTVFNDEANRSIRSGNAPFAGSWRPQTPLRRLNGDPVRGTWRLQVIDDAAGDRGVIGCFALGIIIR